MLKVMVEDLKPEEYLHRAVSNSNCVAWLMGHLVLVERNFMTRIGMNDLPELPDGFEQRYAHNEVAPHAQDYGDVTLLLPLFMQHRAKLIEGLAKVSDASLEEELPKPHPLFGTMNELLAFGPLHQMLHVGQISTIRRSLGRPPIV
jgi:uncharacterized damage-inducible protein DinB